MLIRAFQGADLFIAGFLEPIWNYQGSLSFLYKPLEVTPEHHAAHKLSLLLLLWLPCHLQKMAYFQDLINLKHMTGVFFSELNVSSCSFTNNLKLHFTACSMSWYRQWAWSTWSTHCENSLCTFSLVGCTHIAANKKSFDIWVPCACRVAFLDKAVLELHKTWLWVFQLAKLPLKCVAQKVS